MKAIGKDAAPRIKAVFFDIGNVLLSFDIAAVARKMAFALKMNPLKLARFAWHSKLGERVERGELGGQDLYALFRKELGYNGSYAEFRALWSDHFELNEEIAAILEVLSRRTKVYLLSNTNHLHYEFIRRRYDFAKQVHGAVLSYRVKLRKPEPAIYQEALRKAKVKPEEALFIDDLAENVAGAAKVGMRALRFTGAENLSRALKALALLP